MAFYEEILFEQPTYRLSSVLHEWVHDNYIPDFNAFWGLDAREAPEHLDEDQWRRFVDLSRLTDKLVLGASSLVRPSSVRGDQLAEPEWLSAEAARRDEELEGWLDEWRSRMPDDEFRKLEALLSGPGGPDDPRTQYEFLLARLEILAFERYKTWPAAIAKRMLTLIKALVRQPGDLTRAYLSRVAECYIRAMTTEFAVMARAALDSAIQEILSDDQVRSEVGTRPDARIDLERRIEACRARRLFNEEERSAATRIREQGRDAAHFAPGLEGDAGDLLQDLAACLRALQAHRKGA